MAQLTVWPAFWLVPTFCLVIASFLPADSGLRNNVIFLASNTIVFSALAVSARLILCAHIKKQSFSHIPSALMVKLALVWTSSTSFIPALLGKTVGFVRTSKSVAADKNSSISPVFQRDWLLAITAIIACGFYAFEVYFIPFIAFFLIFLSIPAAWRIEHCLIKYSKTAANH